MNKTAVQWLRERLEEQIPEKMDIVCFWIYLAAGKEKKQIMRAYQDGLDNGFSNGNWNLNVYYDIEYGGKDA